MIKKLIFIATLFSPPLLFAGITKEDAGRADSFLNFAGSARSLSMGQAFSAVADDSSAVYWNPAGLRLLDRKDIVTMYSTLQQDTNFGFLSYGQPTQNLGTFGVGIVNLQSNEFKRRNEVGDSLGTFKSQNSAFLLSHGFRIGENWNAGSTLKVVRQDLDGFSATGFGADMGLLYRFFTRWQAGLAIRNIVPAQLKLNSETEQFPVDLRMGLAFQANKQLMLSSDLGKAESQSIKLRLGSEWKFNEMVSFRGGVNESDISAGLGFNIGNWGIDYAFGYNLFSQNIQNEGGNHNFGFNLKFGPQISEISARHLFGRSPTFYLAELRKRFDSKLKYPRWKTNQLIAGAKDAINRGEYKYDGNLFKAHGYINYFEGNYEKSAEYFARVKEIEPLNQTIDENLEKIYTKISEQKEEKYIANLLAKGNLAYQKNNNAEAIEWADQILETNANHLPARTLRARAVDRIVRLEMALANGKANQGNHVEAFQHLENIRRIDPNNKEALRFTARTIEVLENSRPEDLEDSWGQPLTRYSDDQDISRSIELYEDGVVLYNQGYKDLAIEKWNEAVRWSDSNYLAQEALDKTLKE